MIQIVTAPDNIDVTINGNVVCVSITEQASLEIFLGTADAPMVNKILNSIYEVRGKQMGIDNDNDE